MERIKEEIVSNVDKLQAEVHEITVRLNSIVQQNQKIMESLKLLNYKELLANKDYYLSVTSQQHSQVQLLLTLNLQLEELQNSNKMILKNFLPPDNHPHNLKFRKHNETKDRKLTKRNDSPDSVHYQKQNLVNGNNNNDTTSDSSTLSTAEDLNGANTSDDIVDTLKSHNVGFKQNTIDTSILTKLNQHGLLSRKQKYINNLKKPVMPDLSFKKSPVNKKNPIKELTAPIKSTVSGNSTQLPKNKVNGVVHKDCMNEIFQGNIPPPPEPHIKLLCIISQAKTPSEFYINFDDENIDAIERISVDYAEHHDSPEATFLSKSDAKEKLKVYCLCYVDAWEFWYRAKIVDWQDNPNITQNVTVYLVDYGHTMDLTYKNLRPLFKKYAEIPQCAIKCHLAYLHPPDYTYENQNDTWPEKSITVFKGIVGLENRVLYEVAYVDYINDSWGIDLVRPNEKQDDPSVGQRLLDANVCVEVIQPYKENSDYNNFIKMQLKTALGMQEISSDMNDSDKLETFCKNIDTKEASNLDEALTGYKARDEARTCQVFRRYGTCYKLPNCQFDHEPLRKDGYTTDKVEVHVETTLQLSLPTAGQTVDVRITSISSLTLWYAHISSNIPAYARLLESLNDPKNIRTYKKLDVLPTIGELIIVKNQLVATWCRGLVKEVYQTQVHPEETVQIFLVDTGEIIESKLTELRTITEPLLHIPFQAVKLKISGIKEEGPDNIDTITYCENNYVSQILKATVLHTSCSMLVVSLKKHDIDIRKMIVDDGYGEVDNEDIYPTSALSFD